MNLTPLGSYQHIALGDLQPSPTNPRKSFDPAALAELAASIRELGVIEPITVRPNGYGDQQQDIYEIVTGERRWRASLAAGRVYIPAVVCDMNDDQAAQIQMVENLQRADLHPLEEADGFAALYLAGLTVEDVAKRTGKTVAHVARTMRLQHLSQAAKRLFLAGHITLGHALLLARLTIDDQERAVRELARGTGDYAAIPLSTLIDAREKNLRENVHAQGRRLVEMTEGQLRQWIAENVLLQLAKAPWSLEDPLLVPEAGPCTTCPKRTGSSPALFADLTADADVCTDPLCFQTKQKAFVQVTTKAAEQAGGAVLKLSAKSGHQPLDPAKPWKKPLQNGQWVEAKPESCKSVATGVLVDEPGRYSEVKAAPGTLLTVCADQSCKVHKHHVDAPSPKGGSGNKHHVDAPSPKGGSGNGSQVNVEAKQKAYVEAEQPVRDAVLAAILKVATPGIVEVRDLVFTHLRNEARVCAAMGWYFQQPKERWEADDVALEVIRGEAAEADVEMLGRLVLLDEMEGCREPFEYNWDRIQQDRRRLWSLADRYGVDADAIAAKVLHHKAEAVIPALAKPAKAKLTKEAQAKRKKAAAKKHARKTSGPVDLERAVKAAEARQPVPKPGTPDRKSLAAGPVLLTLLAALWLVGAAQGQTPVPPVPSAPSWTKTEMALAAADVTLRTVDGVSTHRLLAAPCRCFAEDDPLSPHTGALPPLLAFQAGMSALTVAGAHALRRHGHPRLALLLTGADLMSEAIAVQHNLRQRAPGPGLRVVPGPRLVSLPR